MIAKINMQASLLASLSATEADALAFLAKRVRSGDSDNLEPQSGAFWLYRMRCIFDAISTDYINIRPSTSEIVVQPQLQTQEQAR